VGKTYSFAIFGGVVALRELQMCMAFSVGIVQLNFPGKTGLYVWIIKIFSLLSRGREVLIWDVLVCFRD
jgi:hypothetical protein